MNLAKFKVDCATLQMELFKGQWKLTAGRV